MFLIQNIYYGIDTASIGIRLANEIIGAYDTNVVTIFRFTNVIGALALSTPNIGGVTPLCNDPLVEIVKNGLATIIGILTALGVAIAVIGIIVGGLMRATAWGSEGRIAMSNKAISSAVVGLVVVLLGVAVGSAIPNWFGMQGKSCPVSPPSSSPTSAPVSPSTPVLPSTSNTEQKPRSASNQQATQALPAPAPTPIPAPVVAPIGVVPQTTLDYTFQEFNQYTNLTSERTVDRKRWGLNQAQKLTITYTALKTNGSAGYILLEAATLQPLIG